MLTNDAADVQSVLLIGDGWHDVEPASLELGPWSLLSGDVTQEMGPGFRFRSGNLGTVTGQIVIVGAVVTAGNAAPRALR